MKRKKRCITDAVEILHRLFIGNDPQRLLELEEARAEGDIAQLVYDLREESGLTQGQLAKRVGTKASVINDLEEADYEGNMLAMLQRIAAVLGKDVEVRVVAAKRAKKKPA